MKTRLIPNAQVSAVATYGRRRRPSGCACDLPRSEAEGHNCPANGWRWTRWPA